MAQGMKWHSLDAGRDVQLKQLRLKLNRARLGRRWLCRIMRRVLDLEDRYHLVTYGLLYERLHDFDRDLQSIEKERLELRGIGSLCL